MDTAGSHTWDDVLAGVQTLAELIQTCQDAFGEDEAAPKVSVTTKKRLTVRAMQGLQGGSQLVHALAANMRELQQAVQQQQEELQQAMNSNQGLQQQLRGSSNECHSSKRALLQAESQKMGMQQQVEQLQQQLRLATAEKQDLQDTIQDLQAELQGAAQQAADARTHMNQLQQQMEQLAAAAREAEAGADAAAGALDAAREQAGKEQAARARHEDAVARLTADNLVFMARLRAAEADAAAAIAERDELKMALEQHKGPWMDEVHQGVELRVKAAMARAEQLEAQQELAAAQHAQHTQQLQQQHADLEAALQPSQQLGAELREQLVAAHTAASDARTAAEEAAVLASSAQTAADERAAELRVAQESLRSMREECNERWMSERAARTQLVELQERLDAQEAAVSTLQKQLQARSDDLATQRAVNQQLMMKKEEVEWQLLAAIAQLHNHQPAASTGSPESLGTQDSLEKQQQAAIATAAADAPAGSVPEHLPSPFGASALLPLSPVQQHTAAQLPAVTVPPAPPAAAAGAVGTGGLRISTGGGVSAGFDVAPLLPPLSTAAEVPGPAAVAAGGGLWQLPNGSSSGLFGSRVSSSGGGHPLAAIANPMPAATAAAVGALLGNKGVGELHHAFSCPEGDMYSLPRLGFGLATLPTPEQLLAAAEAAATGSGSLQKTVTIGRAGSLTVPVSADGSNSNNASSSGRPDGGLTTIAAAVAAAGGVSSGHSLTITREGTTSSDGPGSVTFRPPVMQPILLGTTGGLMAPFSPLSPGAKGPSSSASRGAVFPECITASAVTDPEQLELGCFGFAGMTDALQQQQQQQVLGPGFWYLQQQQAQQQVPQQQAHPQHAKQRHGSSGSLSDGGQHLNHSSSSPCASSGSLHEAAQQQQQNSRNSAAAAADGSGAGDTAANGATVSAFASAVNEDGVESQRNSNDSRDSKEDGPDSNASSIAGSNAHLHGILRNAPNSRSRSPLTGVSPSGSMKSVRFSFEGLDSAAAEQADSDHELQGDQKGGRRSAGNSNARGSVSPTSRGQGRSSSEWLWHTLYEQLASHSPTAHAASPRGMAGSPGSSLGGGSSHHVDYHHHHGSSSGYSHHDSHRPRRSCHRDGSSGGGSSRQAHGWPASSHPPARAPRGGQYMGRFAEGRHGHSSVQDMIRAQQRQVRQQQVAKEVAAMAAAVKDRSQPKAPVHPIFGVMHTAGDSGSGHPAA